MKRPQHVGCNWEYIEKAVTDNWQVAVLHLGSWAWVFQFFTLKNWHIANFFTLDLDIGDCCVHGNEPYVSINDGMFRPVDRLVDPQLGTTYINNNNNNNNNIFNCKWAVAR
jgi:hypothetical protein